MKTGRQVVTLQPGSARSAQLRALPDRCPVHSEKKHSARIACCASYECGCHFETVARNKNAATDAVLLERDEYLKGKEIWTVNEWGTWKDSKANEITKRGRKVDNL